MQTRRRPQLPSPHRFVHAVHTVLPALALALFAATSLWGCSGDDEPDPAGVYFLHNVADLGQIEFLVGSESLVTLQSGVLSGRQRIDPGTVTLALRSPGAAAVLTQTQVNLTSGQTHLIAVRGTAANLSLVVVDEVPPEPVDSNNAVVEVVNLLDAAVNVDLYIDDVKIAENTAPGSVTPFIEVPSTATSVDVFNSGDVPGDKFPIETAPLDLDRGGAAMIILTEDTTGTAPLAIEILPVR